MQFWYNWKWAEATNETFTEVFTIDIPSTDVLIECWVTQVNQQGSNGQADIAITNYVQNGDPYSGSWPILNGNNITSVTFTLTVNNARATGVGRILAINE
jgi:hypothetical protein